MNSILSSNWIRCGVIVHFLSVWNNPYCVRWRDIHPASSLLSDFGTLQWPYFVLNFFSSSNRSSHFTLVVHSNPIPLSNWILCLLSELIFPSWNNPYCVRWCIVHVASSLLSDFGTLQWPYFVLNFFSSSNRPSHFSS